MATVSVRFWSSFSKRKNSTKQPSASPTRTHDCYLKEDCSIEDPIFCLKIDSGVDPSSYTYCQAFGNYYYITTREYSPPHWNLYCNLDAMATFKSVIGASSLYVLRSYSGYWNDRLVDSVPVMCNTSNREVGRNGNSIYPFPPTNPDDPTEVIGSYVVTIAGGASGNGSGANYWSLDTADFASFAWAFFDVNGWQNISSNVYKDLINPIQYIQDIRWYPFTPDRAGSKSHIWVNGWDTNAEGYVMNSNALKSGGNIFLIPRHPQAGTYGSYLNTSGYSQYTLYDPIAGTFNLDANAICSAENIREEYWIDPTCGFGHVNIFADVTSLGNYDCILSATNIEFGVPVIFSQRTDSSFVSAMGDVLSGQPQNAIGDIIQCQLNPKLTVIGSIGSKSKYRIPPKLYAQFNEIVPIDRSLVGYPCCQTVQLSTIPGFIQCQTGDINVSCAPEYKAEIKAYLEGGFFYE